MVKGNKLEIHESNVVKAISFCDELISYTIGEHRSRRVNQLNQQMKNFRINLYRPKKQVDNTLDLVEFVNQFGGLYLLTCKSSRLNKIHKKRYT